MTRHVSEEREKLAAKLRVTTEQMAHRCSVDQVLWNMHSNACLEAADLLLSTSSAERGMREALETFSKAFVAARERYAKRYEDAELGRANFDAMPDSWLMESLTFNMGAFRKALLALSPKGEG